MQERPTGVSGSGADLTAIRRLRLLLGLLTAAAVLVFGQAPTTAAIAPPAPLNTNAETDSGDDIFPYIASDGAGNWVTVWQSDDDLGGPIGADTDILIARSTDNGATWAAPAPLYTNAGSNTGDDEAPRVATDRAGNWVAVWQSTDTVSGTIGTDWDILTAYSSDDGATWSTPIPLNTNAVTDGGDDMAPQVATNATGNWVAVWQSNDPLGGTIGTDKDILVSRSTDNGATWTAPTYLNANAGGDPSNAQDTVPQIATDGAVNWVTVWQSSATLGTGLGPDEDILVARSTSDGVFWTSPAALNSNAPGDDFPDTSPQLATAGGRWVAIWQSNDSLGDTIGLDSDILMAQSIDNGVSWSPAAALNGNAPSDPVSAADGNPHIATNGFGHWAAVWSSTDDLGGTIFIDPDVLVSRSTDDAGTWDLPVPLNTNAATDTKSDSSATIAAGVGTWVAVWRSFDSLQGTIGIDADVLFTTLDANCGPPDFDGDGWGDACDNCPMAATAWFVPPGDVDCDGFTTSDETVIETDPAVACHDAVGLPDWPPDFNDDKNVNMLDVFQMFPVWFGPGQRQDLNLDGAVNMLDVFLMFPFWFETCT